MGLLTYTQLDSELVAAHGNRDDISAARRLIAINLAQVRIARIYDWNELQEIVTGTIGNNSDPALDKFAAVPDNLRKIYSFKVVDTSSTYISRKLKWIPQRQWDQNIPETEAWTTDIPVIYTIWANRFEFWKIPSSQLNYEIRASFWPSEFSLSYPDATSDLEQKDDMIIALACSWLHLTNRETEEANNWWKIYREMADAATGQEIEEREIDITAPLERSIRGDSPTAEPWRNPFNRSGVE